MVGLALFVYIRPEHTKKVIESIRRNQFEKIYIFQDALKKEEDRPAWQEVSDMIHEINFAETEIHVSDENKGLAESIMDGMNYIFQKHDMAIALEDDVVLAENYKIFVETCLEKYKDQTDVLSVSGGGHGIPIPENYPYDVYFSYRMSSVAFATWHDRWSKFQRDPFIMKSIMRDPQMYQFLDLAGNDITLMWKQSILGQIDTWATYWVLYQAYKKGYHIIPVNPVAIDIGRDGTGTNTVTQTHKYDAELSHTANYFWKLPDEVYLDDRITHDTKALMDLVSKGDKFEAYFRILCKWVDMLHHKRSINDYFKETKITEVYIYGTGRLAKLLYDEIKKYIKVTGFIVEQKQKDFFLDIPLYDIQDAERFEDLPIIITPSYDIKLIEYTFKKNKIINRLILIEELLG